ncbi:MAG: pyridoxamine 5'-phosphate oxidase [Rhodospirillaceae bacterium]|nr:pyridoxamine 5'-phosphate oxidase [Rhodospirillaceae bacterium]|tara:strand:+ start:1519 stop:2205 length:687 start_codon:yes stop_codon:yes gene_type:complete
MTNKFGIEVEEVITTIAELRKVIAPANQRVMDKSIDHIDDLARRFIEKSPFLIIASQRPDKQLDLSPRGDPAGFVKIIDKRTIIIPDRTGNRRMDTFENIIQNPEIALYFLIPGNGDTLRVNGEASIIRDKKLASCFEVQGSIPEMLLLIRIKRVMSHCPKCMIRSGLWDTNKWPDSEDVPTLAEMMVAHGKLEMSIKDMQKIVDRDARVRVYSDPEEYFGYVNLDKK